MKRFMSSVFILPLPRNSVPQVRVGAAQPMPSPPRSINERFRVVLELGQSVMLSINNITCSVGCVLALRRDAVCANIGWLCGGLSQTGEEVPEATGEMASEVVCILLPIYYI